MLDFRIDEELCVGCGECVADCMVGALEMRNGLPAVAEGGEDRCFRCQHCLAVCPTGALSIFGKDPADSRVLKGGMPAPEAMETLIMGRRSTRRFKPEPLDPERISNLLEVVRHAPTGVNRGTTLLTVVDDAAVMERLRRRSLEAARQAAQGELPLPGQLQFLLGYFQACSEDNDVIYRGAPHLLVASAPADNPSGQVDCIIALSYFELLANSHGIGTVWDGIAKTLLTMVAPDLGKLLNIPEDHAVGYMMAFGLPAVKYHRTVQRPQGSINKVTL